MSETSNAEADALVTAFRSRLVAFARSESELEQVNTFIERLGAEGLAPFLYNIFHSRTLNFREAFLLSLSVFFGQREGSSGFGIGHLIDFAELEHLVWIVLNSLAGENSHLDAALERFKRGIVLEEQIYPRSFSSENSPRIIGFGMKVGNFQAEAGTTGSNYKQFIPPKDSYSTSKSNSWDDYTKLLNMAFSAYGSLPPSRRIAEALRESIPYLAVVIGIAANKMFDVIGSLRHLSELVISMAYAQPRTAPPSTTFRQDVILYVLLALFAMTVCVTVWNEFVSSKPRPVSRDLNRAFVGFLIAQISKFVGP